MARSSECTGTPKKCLTGTTLSETRYCAVERKSEIGIRAIHETLCNLLETEPNIPAFDRTLAQVDAPKLSRSA